MIRNDKIKNKLNMFKKRLSPMQSSWKFGSRINLLKSIIWLHSKIIPESHPPKIYQKQNVLGHNIKSNSDSDQSKVL